MSSPLELRALARVETALLGPRPGEPAAGAAAGRRAEGLSIVIPCWNHRGFLPRALRSARAGSDRMAASGVPSEIVVIDDGSRDGSQRLLRSLELHYGDPRLRTVFLERNLGLPRVRNLGLRLARYRHVLLLDADNELLPDNLPAFLASARETGAALVHGNLLDVRDGRVVGLRSSEVASMRLTLINSIDAFAIVDAERLLALGGYATSPESYGLEDWELMLHLVAEEQQIVFVPLVMGYYHILPLSMLRETPRHNEAGEQLLRRTYAQSGSREWDPLRVGRIHHPDTGWLDEGW